MSISLINIQSLILPGLDTMCGLHQVDLRLGIAPEDNSLVIVLKDGRRVLCASYDEIKENSYLSKVQKRIEYAVKLAKRHKPLEIWTNQPKEFCEECAIGHT